MRVVVVGTGLAGVVAALTARQAGAEVVAVGSRFGATALWSGVAEIFGPIYDNVDHQDLIGGPRLTIPGRPPLEDLSTRIERLLRRRSFHPYARLALSVGDVGRLSRQAGDVLGIDLSWPPSESYVANIYGTARLADAAFPSVWQGRLRSDREYVVLGLDNLPAFDAECVAETLASQGLHASHDELEVDSPRMAQSQAEASAHLESLDDAQLTALGEAIAEKVGGRVALLPPVFGRSAAAHRRIWQLLSDSARTSCVAELASVHKSLHGLRFQQHLSGKLDDGGVTVHSHPVTQVVCDDTSVRAVVLKSGERVETDRLILCTGRGVGGGITRSAPLREALLGLPLYVSGAPIEPAQNPAELTTRRLFDDQPLFSVGVGVSSELQPLNEVAEPAYDNLWAAGSLIGGTSPARDGSGFGVALITGYAAGRIAVEEEV